MSQNSLKAHLLVKTNKGELMFMSQKENKSSVSINLFLTEAMTEKVIIFLLTLITSFTSVVVYNNHQQNQLPQNNPVENIKETVK